ncbi:hypothetical protein BDE02_08G130900 [Populus trichocarpa]|nr:hypothetical protein BDE02_08G130900 [Populus trichocarpa]
MVKEQHLDWMGSCADMVFDAVFLISMWLHELFANANTLKEFPAYSVMAAVRRKLVALMPDSRPPNVTLEGTGYGSISKKMEIVFLCMHL